MTNEGDMLTVGQIADMLQEPPQRVAYIITKHRIKAIKRVGIIRLFGPIQVSAIKHGLYNIQIRGQQ